MTQGWGMQGWGISTGTGGGGGSSDNTAPIVTNITPAQGVQRGTMQSVQFDVTDDIGLRLNIIYANFAADQPSEVVWNGLAFLFPYSLSIRTELITGRSYRYVISRQGGWPSSNLQIVVNAVDTSGNET